jgi:hypothetical protein
MEVSAVSDRADPAEAIAKSLGGYLVAGRPYPAALPPELAPWHCYTVDGGHSLFVLLAAMADDYDRPGADPAEYGVAAPVKAVLRAGWTVREDGFVVTDLPFSPSLGLVTDSGDDEFSAPPPVDGTPTMYAVGELYRPGRTQWPQEQLVWRLSDTAVELVMFLRSPTPTEVEAVRTGAARFALLSGEHSLLLASRFDSLPWSDSPWQACRQLDVATGLPLVGDRGHLVVSVILVDTATGIVRVLRQTTWPARFVEGVRAAMRKQARNASTDAQGSAEIDAWYSRYPTTDELVRHADLTAKG